MSNGNAIGIVETSSIAKGFEIADSVLKAANVSLVVNRTICPGKYMVLIGGDVDAVNLRVADLRNHARTPHPTWWASPWQRRNSCETSGQAFGAGYQTRRVRRTRQVARSD